LPQEVLTKQKHGFGLPFGHWLKTSKLLQDIIYGNLSDLKKRNIISPLFIDNLISEHRDGHAAYYGTMIWVLAMLEQWFQEHDISV
jgi:asparagine synthase (glutamine-hydrolysing)